MRIHRTTPTRSLSTFANSLLRDTTISWCAAGVLMYLLSLPPGARASIRALAEKHKEGRKRISESLHELEESCYLRRVTVKGPETGRFSTEYEVFDSPYEEGTVLVPEEVGQKLASGDRGDGVSGPLPEGVMTGEKEPPSLRERERRPRLPKLSIPEQLRSATALAAGTVETWDFRPCPGPGNPRESTS